MNIVIRPIEPADNPALAARIRSTLEEFAVAHPETVYFDPATDALYEFFQRDKAAYNVVFVCRVAFHCCWLGFGSSFATCHSCYRMDCHQRQVLDGIALPVISPQGRRRSFLHASHTFLTYFALQSLPVAGLFVPIPLLSIVLPLEYYRCIALCWCAPHKNK